MAVWQWLVAGGFLITGAVLAVATTTDNKLRWAVMAPAVWGTGMLFIAIVTRDWGPIAISAGMLFYAALNYRNLKRAAT